MQSSSYLTENIHSALTPTFGQQLDTKLLHAATFDILLCISLGHRFHNLTPHRRRFLLRGETDGPPVIIKRRPSRRFWRRATRPVGFHLAPFISIHPISVSIICATTALPVKIGSQIGMAPSKSRAVSVVKIASTMIGPHRSVVCRFVRRNRRNGGDSSVAVGSRVVY